jgi:hypothetical protein
MLTLHPSKEEGTVVTMAQAHPRELIVSCVQHLPEFLPLYNEAATKGGGFVFGAQPVDRFARLWDAEGMDAGAASP